MILVSILKMLGIGLNTAVLAPTVGAVAAFDEEASYRLSQLWARINLAVAGVTVRSRRLARLDPKTPYIFMSNHRSQFDVLAVVEALPEFQLRWVAKKELLSVPLFGWGVRHAGHIIIDRSDTARSIESLRAAQEKMRTGISVIIFPEGTRSPDGRMLLPFKKGGFMMAVETGIPIVPLAIRGSEAILPKGSWQAASGVIDVVVGAPIPSAGGDRDELMRQVRAFMDEHLGIAATPADRRPATAEAV
jgi:1-acyl-sn-glycerol-3-phosphate acyltransferase